MARKPSRRIGMALVAALLGAAPLGVACEPPDSSGFGLPEAAAVATDATPGDTGSLFHDGSASTQDATTHEPEAAPETSTPDGPAESSPADVTTQDAADAGPADTGSSDAASTETGAEDAASEAAVCTAGPGADYQASCTGCSIGASCVLSCTSCTTKAQTQNPDPSLQLPCTGTESVQNEDGVLTCQ